MEENKLKKQLLFLSLLALFVIGAAGVESRVSAQIAGGYAKASVKNSDIRASALFAAKAQSALDGKKTIVIKILKAEVQVVAGLNHRVCMLVRQGRGRSKSVTAVIYKDLNNERSVTAWKVGGCREL